MLAIEVSGKELAATLCEGSSVGTLNRPSDVGAQ